MPTTVVDIWQYIEPRFGGIGPAAAALASSVRANSSDWSFMQVAFCNPEEREFADGIDPQTIVIKAAGKRPISDQKLRNSLNEPIAGSAICHVHGIWQPHSLAVQSLAARLRKPVIASAHGMLEKWELANKPLRKKVYSLFFERRSLAHSFCLRALSIEEANDYRRYGLKRPIAIIPNGIATLHRVDTSALTSRFPETADKNVVLYMSRVHRKKGILNLLASWAETAAANPKAHLLIAGPECPDAALAARRIISRTGVSSSVTFTGVLSGNDKLAALSLARCLCLPSYSEGQSLAVLEALSIGLPVVITTACNVDGVAEAGAGIVCLNTPSELTRSITSILQMNSSSWQMMSDSASRLAETNHNWITIGRKMQSVYEWMLGGKKPEYVID